MKFHVAGITYGPAETAQLRRELIKLRDRALMPSTNDAELAIKLSHAIGLLTSMSLSLWMTEFRAEMDK
jgi:hypothetical protein